jgi:hypothetical protein
MKRRRQGRETLHDDSPLYDTYRNARELRAQDVLQLRALPIHLMIIDLVGAPSYGPPPGVETARLPIADHPVEITGFPDVHLDQTAEGWRAIQLIALADETRTIAFHDLPYPHTARLFLLRSFAERVKTIPLRARALSTMSSTSRLSVVEMTACS